MPEFSTTDWLLAGILGVQALTLGLLVYALMTTGRGRGAGGDAPHPVIAFLAREPAMVAGFVGAAAALTASFGLELSSEQVGAIVAFMSVVLAILVRRSVYAPATVERSNLRYDATEKTLKRSADVG